MKKVLFTLISIYLVSCSGKIDPADISTVDKNIKEYIEKVANDPSSYQPVKTTLVDTIYYSDDYGVNLSMAEYYYEKDSTDENLKNIKICKLKLDSLNKSANPKAILSYVYFHECRLKNKLGALVLKEYRVKTNDSLRVISLND